MKKKTLATLVLCGILTASLISGGMPAVAFAEGLSDPDVVTEQESDIQDEDFADEDSVGTGSGETEETDTESETEEAAENDAEVETEETDSDETTENETTDVVQLEEAEDNSREAIIEGTEAEEDELVSDIITSGENDLLDSNTLIEINETNFPDENFRNTVLEYIDKNKDKKLSETECNSVTEFGLQSDVIVNGKRLKVTSMKGIEYFSKITYLHVMNHYLEELDLSKNPELESVYMHQTCNSDKYVRSIDLSKNTKLKYLDISNMALSKVDLSHNTQLKYLCVDTNLYLKDLDVSMCPNLETLLCYGNDISTLDLRNNPKLKENLKNATRKEDQGCVFYYIKKNGENLLFLQISSTTKLILEDSDLDGWVKVNDSWYYYSNGKKATGWIKANGQWYYLDSGGVMQTGWIKDNNKWYYMSSGGAMQTGWVKVNNKWYYMNSAMQTGWVQVKGTWYFFKPSGVMAENEWYDGYWLSKGGAWTYKAKGSWKQNSKGWWFGDTSGWYAKSTTIKINDKNYTFGSEGYWNNK